MTPALGIPGNIETDESAFLDSLVGGKSNPERARVGVNVVAPSDVAVDLFVLISVHDGVADWRRLAVVGGLKNLNRVRLSDGIIIHKEGIVQWYSASNQD